MGTLPVKVKTEYRAPSTGSAAELSFSHSCILILVDTAAKCTDGLKGGWGFDKLLTQNF